MMFVLGMDRVFECLYCGRLESKSWLDYSSDIDRVPSVLHSWLGMHLPLS